MQIPVGYLLGPPHTTSSTGQAGAASSQPATNEGSAVPGGETDVVWMFLFSILFGYLT